MLLQPDKANVSCLHPLSAGGDGMRSTDCGGSDARPENKARDGKLWLSTSDGSLNLMAAQINVHLPTGPD